MVGKYKGLLCHGRLPTSSQGSVFGCVSLYTWKIKKNVEVILKKAPKFLSVIRNLNSQVKVLKKFLCLKLKFPRVCVRCNMISLIKSVMNVILIKIKMHLIFSSEIKKVFFD